MLPYPRSRPLTDQAPPFHRHVAVFPAKLKVLPQFIFNSRDPIVMGVCIEAGVLKQGTPLCVPSKGVRHSKMSSVNILFCF